MLEFSLSSPVERCEENARQQFISYALIVNIAGFTASTLRYNIPLDNCYSALKNIQLLLSFRTEDKVPIPHMIELLTPWNTDIKQPQSPTCENITIKTPTFMHLEYFRNVSHAGIIQRKEARHKVNVTFCKQYMTSLWTLLYFYGSAKHCYSTHIFIRL